MSYKTVLLGQTVEPIQGYWCCLADYKQMITQKLKPLYKTFSLFIFLEFPIAKSVTAY